ncbi:MerR family transcriptional regulator [Kordiimonas pumila]|uniref:MerR family DNA-binding transcriptional regulator n=1 Tax=Kordiimonas pumila TaxID=2161677 RepID=A0ABV7CZS2_9PROT|nr:MerR family DNA-binding transcriptional regulator [Kordiimonas pumila]
MPDKELITYSINELSREYNVTPRTLRHYEDQGLLSPLRQGQTRIYHTKDRARLAWILRGKRVGFSLQEIGEMLDLYGQGDGREKQRAVTISRCTDRIKALENQRDDINATIDELQEFCDTLMNLKRCEKTGRWIREDTGEPIRNYAP